MVCASACRRRSVLERFQYLYDLPLTIYHLILRKRPEGHHLTTDFLRLIVDRFSSGSVVRDNLFSKNANTVVFFQTVDGLCVIFEQIGKQHSQHRGGALAVVFVPLKIDAVTPYLFCSRRVSPLVQIKDGRKTRHTRYWYTKAERAVIVSLMLSSPYKVFT